MNSLSWSSGTFKIYDLCRNQVCALSVMASCFMIYSVESILIFMFISRATYVLKGYSSFTQKFKSV